MLVLQGYAQQTSGGASFTDATGFYNDPNNLTGYGAPNPVDNPSEFDSYVLKVWAPGNDYYAETPVPTVTIDLQASIPAPDVDDHYVWNFSPAQLGVSSVQDGAWYFEAVGTYGAGVYRLNKVAIFLNDLEAKVSAKMKGWDVTCGCKAGCEDIGALYAKFLVLKCGGVCSPKDVSKVIAWIGSKLKLCC